MCVFLLQLFSTTDPVGTLLRVPEQISAHLPQPAGQMTAQPTQVSLPTPAEPQVQQGCAFFRGQPSEWRKRVEANVDRHLVP